MADDKKPAPAAPADGDGEEKKSNLVVVIGIIAAIIAINGVVAYLVVPRPVDHEAIAMKAMEDSLRRVAEEATRLGTVTETEIEAVVNIAGTDGERFVKAAILLEYDDRKYKRLGAELERRTPQFRDMFIRHMSALTLSEVTEPGAKERIDKDLQRIINSSLPVDLGEIRRVHFTTFIIQ